MTSAPGVRARLARVRREHGRKILKYSLGSVIATVVSTLTFVATFGSGLLDAKGASLSSSATGAVANYFLNRNWTWERRGRADFWRELVPYWATVVITAIIAAVVTSVVNAIVSNHTDNRSLRTAINTIAYISVYGVSFIVKYGLFDRLFSHPSPEPAPMAQASTTVD